jgi:hypothetical protein
MGSSRGIAQLYATRGGMQDERLEAAQRKIFRNFFAIQTDWRLRGVDACGT